MPVQIVDLKEMGQQPEARRKDLINGPHFYAWFHVYRKPGQRDKMHCHNADQTFYMIDGECTMYFPDGGKSVLRPGMAALITGGSFYELENSGDGPMVMMGVRGRNAQSTKKILYETRKEDPRRAERVKGEPPKFSSILV